MKNKKETAMVPFLKSPYAKEVKTIEFNWKDVPTGTPFSANIDGVSCTGRIFNDVQRGKSVYLCQDKMNGANTPNKLGFKYSWAFNPNYISAKELEYQAIKNLKLGVVEKDYVIPEVIKVDYYLV